jgi:hypothetical protein
MAGWDKLYLESSDEEIFLLQPPTLETSLPSGRGPATPLPLAQEGALFPKRRGAMRLKAKSRR